MVHDELSARDFALTIAAYDKDHFETHIRHEQSKQRLRRAIEHEIDRSGETRQPRVARMNQRIKDLS